jgi:hypothetical protein
MKLLLRSSERLLFYSEEGVAGTLKFQAYLPNVTLSYTKFLQFLRSITTFYFWSVKCSGIVSRQVFNMHIFFIKATDLSEASQEAVEEKLRATDRQ